MVYIAEDIVRFRPLAGSSFNLYWGDKVEVLGRENSRTRVRVLERGALPIEGTVAGRLPTQEKTIQPRNSARTVPRCDSAPRCRLPHRSRDHRRGHGTRCDHIRSARCAQLWIAQSAAVVSFAHHPPRLPYVAHRRTRLRNGRNAAVRNRGPAHGRRPAQLSACGDSNHCLLYNRRPHELACSVGRPVQRARTYLARLPLRHPGVEPGTSCECAGSLIRNTSTINLWPHESLTLAPTGAWQ